MVEKSPFASFWPSLYEPFRAVGSRLAELVSAPSEASSNDSTYRIALELPGVADEDIQLTVDQGVVTVRGEKKTEREEKGETWYFSERQYGAFSRSFRLPPDADENNVKASLKDGVLTVSVGKRAPDAPEGAKRVPISRG